MAITLLALPAEIRNAIFNHVYSSSPGDGYKYGGAYSGLTLDERYSSTSKLHCLLTCRQLYNDAVLLAFARTHFIITNLFVNIPSRLATLQQDQIESIRSLSFVADARHFRKLHVSYWGQYPFGLPSLNLDILTVVLHRSSSWHYLFDFTSNIVQLLRHLKGIKSLVIVRNKASVKGSLKTWYNRLVGLILKMDHHQRFIAQPPELESTWWTWSFDERGQAIRLNAKPARPMVDEMTYVENILPLVDELRKNVENEEWNPDPRSWSG